METQAQLPGYMVPGNQAPDPQAESQKATDPTMAALMQILQQSNRARVQQQPPAVPSGQSPTPQAPQRRRGGPGEFLSAIGTSLSGIAKQQQQKQLAQATNLYGSYMTTLDKYVKPDGSIDMQKALQDPFIQSIKPADLKKMSKALAAPWLDPGKTTVETQALAAVAKKRQAQQQARQGLDKLFHGLVQKATAKPQLSPEQQQAQKAEVIARTPTTAGVTDPKDAIAALDQINKMQNTQAELGLKQQELENQKQAHLDTLQEHKDALQERYDALQEKMQESKDRLADKQATDAIRQQSQQEMIELRKQSIGIQQELAQTRLGLAETPKDRQTWVNNTLKELMQNRATAAKDMSGTMAKLGIGDAKQTFQMYDDQIKALQGISSDIIRGKITTQDAMQKIYGGSVPAAGGDKSQDPLGLF